MSLPPFPTDDAATISSTSTDDMINGGHRTRFFPLLNAVLSLAGYVKAAVEYLIDLADRVADDAASAAAGSGTEVSVPQIWAGGAAQYLSIRRVIEANAPIPLIYASTITLDLDTGINFSLPLAGPAILGNPTNAEAGKSGFIVVTQDATGGRSLGKGSHWKVAGGAFNLNQAPGAKNVIAYFVESPTSVLATVSEAMS
jgi:hypothetical protein